MNIDIYIREKDGGREIRVPWLPQELTFNTGGTVRATYDIMNNGPIEVPLGSGLCEYSWKSIFPGAQQADQSMMRGSWMDPSVYHNILEDWKKKGTKLNILVTGYPINTDVVLDNYQGSASGAFGDIEYSVSFVEYKSITITSTGTNNATAKEATVRPAQDTTTYTIKSGDTLWKIAKQFLGNGSQWQKIYDLNKDIIESTAKKRWKAQGIDRDSQNGHWIFPGTKIQIPK